MKVQLTERELKRYIKKCALNEVNGWSLENDDITLVNDESDGNSLYLVKLWWGSGYLQDCYNAFANSEEEALYYTVVWVENNHPEWLETSDKNAESLKQELAEDNGIEDYEAEGLPEFNEAFMCVDATMEGANSPHYIYTENLHIVKYPKEHNYPMAQSSTKMNESKLKQMISETVKKVLKESLNDITVSYDSPTKGKNQIIVKSLQDAQKMIPSDATYFDITKGSNTSEEDNLISWGGKDGYWDNATNPDFKWGQKMKQKEIDSALRKRKF